MKVWFEQREELAPGIWQYSFHSERPVDFVPGQYLDVRLSGVKADPRGAARTFTLTSLPSDSSLRFVLKHFTLQSPYKHVLQQLQPNDEASITDTIGDLVLPKSPDTPLVFIAGGIGIASYASMLQQLLSAKEERPIFLFYVLRSRREQIFRSLIDAYPLMLKQTILAPNQLSAQEIKATTPPESLVYLSGSQRFVEALRDELEALGTPRERIVFDYYDGYADL